MAGSKDSKGYYALLGVSEKAGYPEIKRSYRKLARKYHPDRNRSAHAEEMIKKINAAFEVLSDEAKRSEYDRSEYGVFSSDEPQHHHDYFHNDNGRGGGGDSNSGGGAAASSGAGDAGGNGRAGEASGVAGQQASTPWKVGSGRAATAAAAASATFRDLYPGPTFLDTPKGRFHIIVEPSLCMAFGSCETLAPKVFVVEKNKRVNPKARVECETCAELEKVYAAAQTCPTKAIKIVDRYTGEQLFP